MLDIYDIYNVYLYDINTKYNTYRASRNLSKRDLYTTEYIYILEK